MNCCNNPNIIKIPFTYDPKHRWYLRCLNCDRVKSVHGCDGIANENWIKELAEGLERELKGHNEESK